MAILAFEPPPLPVAPCHHEVRLTGGPAAAWCPVCGRTLHPSYADMETPSARPTAEAEKRGMASR